MNHPFFSTTPVQQNLLRQEAITLHRFLFGAEAPPELIEQYAQAHSFIRLSGSDEHLITVSRVIELGLDAEAIELALRNRHPRHPLRQKLQILTYLAEADSRYYSFFINTKTSFSTAIIILAGQLCRTVGKIIKGKILVWRYSLA